MAREFSVIRGQLVFTSASYVQRWEYFGHSSMIVSVIHDNPYAARVSLHLGNSQLFSVNGLFF